MKREMHANIVNIDMSICRVNPIEGIIPQIRFQRSSVFTRILFRHILFKFKSWFKLFISSQIFYIPYSAHEGHSLTSESDSSRKWSFS